MGLSLCPREGGPCGGELSENCGELKFGKILIFSIKNVNCCVPFALFLSLQQNEEASGPKTPTAGYLLSRNCPLLRLIIHYIKCANFQIILQILSRDGPESRPKARPRVRPRPRVLQLLRDMMRMTNNG